MARERFGLIQFSTPSIIKAASTRTQNPRSDKRCKPTGEVNNARPSKVNHPRAPKRFLLVGAEEAILTPYRVHNDRVDEAGEERGVEEVGGHLAALRQRPGDDGGGGGSEGELEEPKGVIVHVHQEEVAGPDEGGRTAVLVPAEGEGVADGVEAQRGPAGVEEVFEHRVLNVLNADGAGAQHGEACLHEEDQRGGENQVELVDAEVRHPLLLVRGVRDALEHLPSVREGLLRRV
mmetsp:Transcript_15216/g.20770  ORF Transcript_15216/g.20770 Transcript_15216/m.20770 type:complete len:234 (-) Transcript_15216:124-825(-)